MIKERYDLITSSTNGEIKYCEQLLLILMEAGFSRIEGDMIRKAYIKKKADEIAKWEEKIKGAMENDLALDIINNIRRNIASMTYKTHMTAPLLGCFSDTCSICKGKAISIKVGEDGKTYCIPCSEKDEYKNTKFIAILDIGISTKDRVISEE